MPVYHKEIYFPLKDKQRLKNLTSFFNRKVFIWNYHARKRLIERIHDLKYFYNWLKNLHIDIDNIIEYTLINNDIEKVLFKFKYDNFRDICISIGKAGNIITLYFNNAGDNHKTLNKSKYERAI